MTFPSIRIEGAILSGDLLAKLDKGDFTGQRPADFGLDSQPKLKEEIVRAWTAAQAFYVAFQHKLEGVKEGNAATSETRNQWMIPVLGLLGYAELEFQSQSELVGDKPFRLSHHLRSHGGFRVHIVGARESLDKKPASGPRVSPHAHLQEYLNLTEHLYGLVTNGKLLRLLRDSTRLIKLSYVEFDLDRMFGEELFADFAVLYRLLHVTRLPRSSEKSSESLLERYHQDALESGARIRDGLSFAVEQVVQELGSGFLARNEALQAAVANNSVTAREVHHALLRLIYRLLLMMVAEERGLLFTEAATPRQRKLYLDHYSINRLRRLAERRALADSTKHDLWRGLRSTFRLFETDGPGAPLGLTGLGGQLFSASALGPLQSAELDNGTLLSAIAKLSLFRQADTGQLSRVNYGALATEEFGSVYERLLELHPVINPAVGNLPPTFAFKQAAGNERKTSGSYYTPSSLVECLLDSALDPVLDDRLKNFSKLGYKSADEAVLALKVCDPACGSGHFLIAAAQRIARRLALLRSKGDEPSVSELRHTLREVISHCIYGVDINPMSVELCKVGLWLEAMEAGKPLSFLDHHIRCGNSLLGATPALIAEGIPDDAFTAIEGDDKKACAALKKLNARERKGFGELFADEDRAAFERLQQAAVSVENLPDDSVSAVEQKSAAFDKLLHDCDFEKATDLANLWCAAFVIRKRMADGQLLLAPAASSAAIETQPTATQPVWFGDTIQEPTAKPKTAAKVAAQPSGLAEAIGITSGHLRDFAKGTALPNGLMREARQLAGQYNFFHWHLAFPEIFYSANNGGFSVILGNPPWEMVTAEQGKVSEDEFARIQLCYRSNQFKILGGRRDLYKLLLIQGSRVTARSGRLGFLTPLGVFVEDDSSDWRKDFFDRGSVVELRHFQNHLKSFFSHVHASYRFCAVVFRPTPQYAHGFTTTARHPDQVTRQHWITVARSNFDAVLGEDRSAIIFPDARYSEIHERVRQKLSALHQLEFRVVAEFHASTDKALVRDARESDSDWELLKNRNIHQFVHHYAPIEAWISAEAVRVRLIRKELPLSPWLERTARLMFRDIARNDDERTLIACLAPIGCVSSYDTPMVVPHVPAEQLARSLSFYIAAFNSFASDFFIRPFVDKHIKGYTLRRVPWPEFSEIENTRPLAKEIIPRILELTYTDTSFEQFAQDCGWFGPPFRWDEERRFQLRCELDAAFFHLYGLNRDDTAYILDTFPIVKRKDEEKHGHYRTKDRILELYDALAECQRTNKAFVSSLNPAPASLLAAHPWNWEGKPLELPSTPRIPLPENWQYVVNVMVELLWQAGGSLPWRVLRSATDLLADRARLAQLAELHVGQVALDWQALNGDSFDAQHRWDQLSGFCNQGKMRVVRRNDDLVVELLSADGHVLFPHVRFDARIALTVVRTQPATTPTSAETKEERRVAELIPA